MILLLVILGLFLLWAILTNPFWFQWHIVQQPYTTTVEHGFIRLIKKYTIHVRTQKLARWLALIKCAYHIVSNSMSLPKGVHSNDLNTIITKLVFERFNPNKPYIIAGDQFIVHYPRNLGVFYYPAFDASTALTLEDWTRRQQSLLQTVAFNLAVFSQTKTTATTLVPMSLHSVTPINIFAYPSDSLYSLLFALHGLKTKHLLSTLYPYHTSKPLYPLMALEATEILLSEYKSTLALLLNNYMNTVFDSTTGLIKTNIHLSGTKDITKRTGAFYDNVILWRTLSLAQQLNIPSKKDIDLEQLKKRILDHYWLDKEGYFLEDDSAQAKQNEWYSSDWLVVLFTSFLKVNKDSEKNMYERIVAHIITEKLDEPLPLRYHEKNRATRQYGPVRLFLPEYGGSAIWSFWGMEYCKLLVLLYVQTKKLSYLKKAKKHYHSYASAIVHYRGFPEVYNTQGVLLARPWYRSMIKTGWVVNFVQLQAMLDAVSC